MEPGGAVSLPVCIRGQNPKGLGLSGPQPAAADGTGTNRNVNADVNVLS